LTVECAELLSALNRNNSLILLLNDKYINWLQSKQYLMKEMYLHSLEKKYIEIGTNKIAFIDFDSFISHAAYDLILKLYNYMKNDTYENRRKIYYGLSDYKLFLTRNIPPKGGRTYGDINQINSLVSIPDNIDQWPLGLPEVEALNRELITSELSYGELVHAKSYGWRTYRNNNQKTVLYFRVPLENSLRCKTDEVFLVNNMFRAMNNNPGLMWALYSSTIEDDINGIYFYKNTLWTDFINSVEHIMSELFVKKEIKEIIKSLSIGSISEAITLILEIYLDNIGIDNLIITSLCNGTLGIILEYSLSKNKN